MSSSARGARARWATAGAVTRSGAGFITPAESATGWGGHAAYYGRVGPRVIGMAEHTSGYPPETMRQPKLLSTRSVASPESTFGVVVEASTKP